MFFEYGIFEPPEQYKIQRKTALFKCGVSFGGSGWIRTTSVVRQQIYSLPRLSNSGARPELSPFTLSVYGMPHKALAKCGAGSGNRTRISSLEGLHTSLCTMPATNSKQSNYILLFSKRKYYLPIGGKHVIPSLKQQLKPWSPKSVYVSPEQQPFTSGSPPSSHNCPG